MRNGHVRSVSLSGNIIFNQILDHAINLKILEFKTNNSRNEIGLLSKVELREMVLWRILYDMLSGLEFYRATRGNCCSSRCRGSL